MSKKTKPATLEQALWACELLERAYQNGEDNGSDMDWNDVDVAWGAAKKALKLARKEGYT